MWTLALEPAVTINNGWSNRYTMMEVTGLDRPGLLFELTATLSKLNLNIASAHVATFGERVVDVFYVTDLFGAKITSAIGNAKVFLAIQKEHGSFDAYLRGFTLSAVLSTDLRKRGMRFVGPTIVESFMEATGRLDHHEPGCFRTKKGRAPGMRSAARDAGGSEREVSG